MNAPLSLAECLGRLQATIISLANRNKTDYQYQVSNSGGIVYIIISISGSVNIEINRTLAEDYESEILTLCGQINALKSSK